MGHGLLVCHSHLPGGRAHFATVCSLIQHLFSEHLLQWLLGSTDQKQRCGWGSREAGKEWWRAGPGVWEILKSDPGSLQGGISGTGPGRRSHSVVTRPQRPQGTFLIKPSLLWLQTLALGLPPLGAVFLATTHTSGRSKLGGGFIPVLCA